MKIIELPKPKLPKVKMECDKVIDPKLEQVPSIKICFSKSSTTLITGGCGSGKTTLVIQMLKGIFKKCFEDIFLIMPENSYQSIAEKDNIFKQQLPPENIYHEFNEDILKEIYKKLEENASDKNNSLLIIDDFGHIMRDKHLEKLLNKICLKNRHLKTSVMILTQNYYMMGRKLREIMNNVVMFNTNKSQNKKLFDEQFDLKESQFRELMKLCPTTHDYLLLNLKYKKIYHNFNEISFDDE